MTKKLLCFSVIGAMVTQSVAFASNESQRVDALSNQPIVIAQNDLEALRADLISLDKTLVDASKSIKEHEEKGVFSNGAAVVGAAVGLGLSALTYASVKSKYDDRVIRGIIFSVLATAATLASATAGGIGDIVKSKANVQDLDSQLTLSQEEIRKAQDAGVSREQNRLYNQLSRNLTDLQESVRNFDARDSGIKRSRILFQVDQAVGVALAVLAVKGNSRTLGAIGALVGTAGNIGALVMGFSKPQADKLLSEIEKTRAVIANLKI